MKRPHRFRVQLFDPPVVCDKAVDLVLHIGKLCVDTRRKALLPRGQDLPLIQPPVCRRQCLLCPIALIAEIRAVPGVALNGELIAAEL